MKLVVLGASGWIGSHIVAEAKSRGHQVTALVRNEEKYEVTGVTVKTFDLTDNSQSLNTLITDETVFAAAIGGRALANHEIVANTAKRLLVELPDTNIQRLIWVGGAGSLTVAPNLTLVNTPQFPTEYKDEAIAQGEALTVFKHTVSKLPWTFISPAAEIFPGDALGKYRLGGDQLLTDEDGNSRISVADYAKAFIDEIEQAKHLNTRISVAY